MPPSTVALDCIANGQENELGGCVCVRVCMAAVVLSSSPCSVGDVFIWVGMLQREAV